MEETLKIEEEEAKLQQKIDFHQSHSSQEAEILSRKQDELNEEQKQLLLEEGERRAKVKKMVKQTDGSLSPIKDVLVNFEGMQ